jgi:hypothetical protein
MNLRIELTQSPTEEQRQAILQPLIEYNDAQTGGSKSEPFALMVKDQNGEILGGLYGRMIFRWMFIELLSVPEQGRGQGLEIDGSGGSLGQGKELLRPLARHVRFSGAGVLQEAGVQPVWGNR